MRTGSVAILVIVHAIAVGFLTFTRPGHRLLYTMGFTAACSSDNCE